MTAVVDEPRTLPVPDVIPVDAPRSNRHRKPEAGSGQRSPRRDARRRAQMGVGRGTVVWALATVSLISLWFVAYAVLLTPFQESRAQAVLYNTMRERLALETAPLGGSIAAGDPVAILTSPRLGLADVVVVEGTASGDLMAGPGHYRASALPGQSGVAVLYGRATLYGAPFGLIASAHVGDTVTATTGQGVFTYSVIDVRRAGDPLPQPLAAGAGRLTLVTAEGSGRFGSLSPSGTIYVDLRLDGTAQPYPSGRPVVVPQAEMALQGDPSALLPLAVVLPLLVGAVVFAVYAWNRWGRWQAWVVGAPLILASLYLVSQCTFRLLPNLL